MSSPSLAKIILRSPAGWIASVCGVGLMPRAPGTFGSLAALVPWWLWLRHQPLSVYLVVLFAGFALGVWASGWVIEKIKIEDPSVVVWDEVIGQWIALMFAPPGLLWLLLGFVLFRIFDIAKPWPVSWADRKLHGGFGAMFDDVLAGLYALAVLQAIHLFV